MSRGLAWPLEDEEYLRDNYNKKTMVQLMHKLKRTDSAISTKASQMGFIKRKFKDNSSRVGRKIALRPMQPITLPAKKVIEKHKKIAGIMKSIDPIANKRPVYIDSKTTIYVPLNATEHQVNEMVSRIVNKPSILKK